MRLLFLIALVLPAAAQVAGNRVFRLEELKTPPGFEVTVFATVPGVPRHMTVGPNGVLYVATRGNGRVIAIPERDRLVTVLQGLNGPHTLEFRDGALYVSVNDGVVRYANAVTEDLVIRSQATRLLTVPSGGQHSTRTLGFGPDGNLYLSLGSTCNFCVESDRRRAAMLRFNADGTGEELYAAGLRNTVGFAFHPVTGELWGVDHGGDNLGDNEPPEEINIIRQNIDYGWPDCIGAKRGANWGPQARTQRCGETEAPVWEMQAHSAPLGIGFYTGDQFLASFRNDALVAFHGSWNRSQPTGYKVVRIRMTDNKPSGQEDFLWGFLDPNTRTRSGRPVQAITGPDGAVYVSDDGNSNIYRIEWVGPRINDGGIAKVVDNIYAMYGFRLGREPGEFMLTANGVPVETLYIGENQVNFALPAGMTGDVLIRVENGVAADEQSIRVD